MSKKKNTESEEREPTKPPKGFLCTNCFEYPQLPSSFVCNKCTSEFASQAMRRLVERDNIRAMRIKGTALGRPRRLVACGQVEIRQERPYEISFIVSSGMRVAESFENVMNAQTRFNELKLADVCGLRLSLKVNNRIKELNSHNGTFRPVVRRTDDIDS